MLPLIRFDAWRYSKRARACVLLYSALALFSFARPSFAGVPAGCTSGSQVASGGGYDYTTIGAAVAALPATLTGAACVMIMDSATYNEQVTVRNFTNNGSSITIYSDPNLTTYAAVNPPAASTAAFQIDNASVNIQRVRIIPSVPVQAGVTISSAYVTVSSVSIQDGAGRIWSAGISLGDWNTVSYTSITMSAPNSAGYYLSGVERSTIQYSTAATSHASAIAVYSRSSSSNVYTRVHMSNASGASFQFDDGSNGNVVSFSTITGNELSGFGAFHFDAVSSNTVTDVYVGGGGGVAVNLQANANFNVISLSTAVSASSSWATMNLEGASSNTIVDSRITNTLNNAVYVQASANGNLFSRSTITMNTDFAAFYVWNSATNTISQCYVQNLAGHALYLDVDAQRNVVARSTIVASAANRFALYVDRASSNTIVDSYLRGSTAAYVSGSTGTAFGGSVLEATAPAGAALTLRGGSVNLTVTSSTLKGLISGSGLDLQPNSKGRVFIDRVIVSGVSRGLRISTQAAGFSLDVDSITFRQLETGATAIHFLGGTFVATITAAGFEDASLGVNVSGAALNTASRLTMLGFTGARAGPAYENDPQGLVEWVGAACGAVYRVGGGETYSTIQSAVDAIPGTLTQSVCVDIMDSASYAESVTVAGKTVNGHRIHIRGTQSQPATIVPPSTGGIDFAFDLNNASVTLHNVLIRPTASIEYGVRARGVDAYLSSVTVDAPSLVSVAGVTLESERGRLTASSVTVGAADGVFVSGSFNQVDRSSMQSGGPGWRALYAIGGSSNVFSVVFASSTGGIGILGLSSPNLRVESSTAAASSASHYALSMNGSTGAVVSDVYAENASGGAVEFTNSAHGATATGLHAVSSGAATTFDLFQVSSVTVSHTTATNRGSATANAMRMTTVGYSSISASTFTTDGGSALQLIASTHNVLSGLYVRSRGFAASALLLTNSSNENTVSGTTVAVGEVGATAVLVENSSSGTLTGVHVSISSGLALNLYQTSGMLVDNSTFTTDGDANAGVLLNGTREATLRRVYGRALKGDALYLVNAHRNRVEQSTFTTDSAYRAIHSITSSSNVYEIVLASNPAGTAVYWYGSEHSTFTLSTAASNSAASAMYIESSTGTLVDRAVVLNAGGNGLYVAAGSHHSTISFTTMLTSGTAGSALNVGSSSVTVRDSFVVNSVGNGFSLGGGWNTVMRTTISASGQAGWTGFYVVSSSWTSVNDIYSDGRAGSAVVFWNANRNTVARSTFTNSAAASAAAHFLTSSSNTFTMTVASNAVGTGFHMEQSDGNALTACAVVGANTGVYMLTAKSNSFVGCTIEGRGGHAAQWSSQSDLNTVSGSTMVAIGPAAAWTLQSNSSSNTVTGSVLRAESGLGVNAAGTGNRVIASTVVSQGNVAFQQWGASGTVVQGSYLSGSHGFYVAHSTASSIHASVVIATGSYGAAVLLGGGARDLTLTSCTLRAEIYGYGLQVDAGNAGRIFVASNSIAGAANGVHISTLASGAEVWIVTNTIIPSLTSSADTFGVHLDGLASGATIQANLIAYREVGSNAPYSSYGLWARTARGLVIERNRVNMPGLITGGNFYGVSFSDVDDASLLNNDIHSTGTATNMTLIQLLSGSTGVRLRGNVAMSSATAGTNGYLLEVDAGSQSGFDSDYNDWFSSGVIQMAYYGGTPYSTLAAYQSASSKDGASISANPLWADTSAGVDDFHPKSRTGRYAAGSFVLDSVDSPTIDRAPPSDAYAGEPVPNGGRANQGAYGGTAEASKTATYPGCSLTNNVGAGMPYATIQAGVNALPQALTGHSCVVIRDAATYAEQVSVRNFTMNGSSITIFTDPAAGSYAVVDPPAASTAAFEIANASVNIQRVAIYPTADIAYGVSASSQIVSLSSVTISTGASARIWTAGIQLQGWSRVDRSSVVVGDAHGILLVSGSSWTTITRSSAVAGSGNSSALFIGASDSNTVSGSYFHNSQGYGASFLAGADDNALAASTFTSAAPLHAGVYADASDRLSLSGSYAFSQNHVGVWLTNGSDDAQVVGSTIVSASVYPSLRVQSPRAVVSGSWILNAGGGPGLSLQSNSAGASVTASTMTSLDFSDDGSTVTASYIGNPAGIAVTFNAGGERNLIAGSTIVAGTGGSAVNFDGADSNTITGSFIRYDAANNFGVLMQNAADGNEIRLSTVVSAAWMGVHVQNSSGAVFAGSYLQGGGGLWVLGSTGTIVTGSTLVATSGGGHALHLESGSESLFVASTTLRSGASGDGLRLDPDNAGTVSLGSVTISAAARGVSVATQSAGFVLAIDSANFRGLASGATAIHFLGGTFVATITAAGFEDAGVGANASAAALDGASRITMRGASGARFGPAYENDPASLVDWPDLGAPTTPALWFVAASSGGLTYGTVGADGYTVQASTAADFTGVLHSSTAFNGEDRLAPTTLDPNTTYYFRVGALWGASTVYAQTTVSSPTLASLVSATTTYQIFVTSIVINWGALPLAPPDASSNTSEGYLLEVADDIEFTKIVSSSRTANPALSTLTVTGLYGDATYYFRVGSLNWSGAAHYAVHHATYLPPILGVDLTTISVVVPGGTPMNTEIVVTTATIVTNTGNVNETYHLRVTTVSAGSPWFVGASPHSDRYAAWAVFNSTQPAAGDFDATDQLADGETECLGAFSMGNETCEQVPPGETRTLWMKLWTPLVTTTGNSQDIRLIVRPEYAR